MTFAFRPALETMDARDLPAVTIQNAWVSSVQPAPTAALVSDQVAPAPVPPVATYDLKALKKL